MSVYRLDKFLADMDLGTRSELKKTIKKGLVTVNGVTAQKPEMKIDTSLDQVCYNGTELIFKEYEYFLLHKPQGVVSATEDNIHQTVLDLIEHKTRKDLFPVGRLDIDTEGLLLITNDGELSHRLLSPKKHVDKTYYAKIDGVVTKEDITKFAKGLDIGEEKNTLPAKLNIIKSAAVSEIEITIHEGKFHQIKRMFEAVGKEVVYLKRMKMGTLVLDPSLQAGEYRTLTEIELKQLKGLS